MGTRLGPNPTKKFISAINDDEPQLNMTIKNSRQSGTLSKLDNLSIRDELKSKSVMKVAGPTPQNRNPFFKKARKVPLLRYDNSNNNSKLPTEKNNFGNYMDQSKILQYLIFLTMCP